MKYRYLYQTKENENREGWIKARSRDEAYTLLRKQGIKPYRVIGDDPFNWRPWAIAGGYILLLAMVFALSGWILYSGMLADNRYGRPGMPYAAQNPAGAVDGETEAGAPGPSRMSAEQAAEMRLKASEAVMQAPDAYRYHVWRSVNVRLKEMGIAPLEKPADMPEPAADLMR